MGTTLCTLYYKQTSSTSNTTRCLHNKKTPLGLGSRLDSSKPLHILHSSILFLPETRAYNVPKKYIIFRFCGAGSKSKLYKAKKSTTPRSSPLSPHHKIKIIK